MTEKERQFRKKVLAYYRRFGRHDLPWRKTHDPYRILVSEVMLQQTQVDRVRPKYREFLARFPTARRLAAAPLGDVLRVWQGLGYNRRAKHLQECAKAVVSRHRGTLPRTYPELVALPGVGPYTAAAVLAFAYNEPVPLIETNVRAAYLHHFFSKRTGVKDADIMRLVERTLDMKNPREWYAALMDYGAHLKKTEGNASRRSAHHTNQSTFEGSARQLRGAILRALAEKPRTLAALKKDISDDRLEIQLAALAAEGLITKKGRQFTLPH